MPALLHERVLRGFVGFRPSSPDGLPMIGWVDDSRLIAVASGHEGSGHGLAAVTGQLVRMLMDGQESSLLETVSPRRFLASDAA
jgi:glycine/D-amino acid oxidase-like deaminating enzyme